MDTNNLLTGSLVAGALAGWNQIKGIFERLRALIIVKIVTEDNELGNNCGFYFRKNFKESALSNNKLLTTLLYIKSKKKFEDVVFFTTPENGTFFKGWVPIFLSQNRENTGKHITTISFIRGTFKTRDLIKDIICFTNGSFSGEKSSRFGIYYCYGSKYQTEFTSNSTISAQQSFGSEKHDHLDIISHDKDDIGISSPVENLLIVDDVHNDFEQKMKYWLESKDWYESKGIPWRIGAGFFGSPGTGKSSFVKLLAKKFNLPIYVFDLTTFSNKDLQERWKEVRQQKPLIILFEDIDRLFDENRQLKTTANGKQLTLNALLNCISGVDDNDGVCVIATANNTDLLDPALGVPDSSGISTRPGRFDHMVFMGPLNESQRQQIADKIIDNKNLIPQLIKDGDGETGAQFVKRCSEIAIKLHWEKPTLKLLKVD